MCANMHQRGFVPTDSYLVFQVTGNLRKLNDIGGVSSTIRRQADDESCTVVYGRVVTSAAGNKGGFV